MHSESKWIIYQQVDYRKIPVVRCLQRASPPCSSITFSRSCLPPFSYFPHVGSASVGSHSRQVDSSLATCLVLGGGFCPFRRASVDSSLALSASYAVRFLTCSHCQPSWSPPSAPRLGRFLPRLWLVTVGGYTPPPTFD